MKCLPEVKYHQMCIRDRGEVVGKYHRRPAFAKHLTRMALKGRPDTLGQLELIPSEKQNTSLS